MIILISRIHKEIYPIDTVEVFILLVRLNVKSIDAQAQTESKQ